MVEALNMLYATLGTTTNVTEDTREGRLGTEVVYTVRPYSPTCTCYNTSKGMVYFTDPENNKLWFRIVDIKPISKSTGFCLEVDEAFEPQFTIGDTGIITHNCRLKLDNRVLAYKGGGLFGASSLTGSCGVVTLNLPRLGYLSKDQKDSLS